MARAHIHFDDFVVEHGSDLLRTAFLISGDQQEAEDLVQECFLTLSKHWNRVAGMDYPYAYGRRVLVNLATRSAKSQLRRRAELEAELPDLGVDEVELAMLETRDELRVALKQLTPRQRAILVLRYFNGLSEAEVAETMGCATGTVKSTTSRSLAQLRDLIEGGLSQKGLDFDER
jgi:RNA polymerase sigma-70 factor (sigma-E family)